MKKLFAILFLSAAAVTFTACGGNTAAESGGKEESGDKVMLRFKPAKGDKKSVEMKMNMDYMGITMEMGMYADMNVLDVKDNGNIDMESVYKRITVKMNMMGQNIEYDSESDKDVSGDPMMQAYSAMATMLNKPITMVMNDQGGVVEAPDMSALLSDSLMAMSGEGGKNSDQMGQMFDNMFAPFPEKEVAIGDSWDKEAEIKSANGPMRVKAKYKVENISDKEVTLSVEGDLNGDMEGGGQSVKMSGKMSGNMIIDREQGWTNSVNMLQDISMTVMGQNVNMKINLELTIK